MIDDVIDRLATHCLVLIHGASGSGKSSSFARAYSDACRTVSARRCSLAHLRRSAVRRSVVELASEFAGWRAMPATSSSSTRSSALSAPATATLASFARRSERQRRDEPMHSGRSVRGIFRLREGNEPRGGELFVDLLVRAAPGKTSDNARSNRSPGTVRNLHVIVTMRSEYLGECARFEVFAEAINRTQYLVPGMDRHRCFGRYCGQRKCMAAKYAELAERLISEAGGREDELPLIQHGLMLIWEDAVVRAGPGERVSLRQRHR